MGLNNATSNFVLPQKAPGMTRRAKDRLVVFLFLLPALVLFLLFVVYPIFRSAYFSTLDWKGLGAATKNIGLGNYSKILADDVFLKSVKNVLIIIVLSLGLQLPAAIVLANMVGCDLPGRGLFSTICFLP